MLHVFNSSDSLTCVWKLNISWLRIPISYHWFHWSTPVQIYPLINMLLNPNEKLITQAGFFIAMGNNNLLSIPHITGCIHPEIFINAARMCNCNNVPLFQLQQTDRTGLKSTNFHNLYLHLSTSRYFSISLTPDPAWSRFNIMSHSSTVTGT